MKRDPQFRVIELEAPMRTSLGKGTRIASVHIEFKDIHRIDLQLGETKRDFATALASKMAKEKWEERFGSLANQYPVQHFAVQEKDAVTVEIWVPGPEQLKVKII